MNPESSPAETIFGRAIAIGSAVERAAFLEHVCAHDPALRKQVEELVDNHFKAGSFLEHPAPPLGATIDLPTIQLPGTQIGPYKLLQEIGEGGMGVVYMAEQTEPVQRRVALKIIKPGMDSRKAIARFEAERQALALMDHPNIAKVLDAGTTEPGRLYFVMELVKGAPITTYCDAHHLTLSDRLAIFLPVCQAVQHAHQKGVIHRDLKPSNVMVALYDGRPVPKVIDFGVAKATAVKLTEKTLFTEFGQVVGTPEYMSPEQAELNQLDIDTRSDIYSLGVLLYELLTGTTPLERKRLQTAAFDEMLRIIREDEPPKPSTRLSTTDDLPLIAAHRGLEPKKLSGLVRGDLDWIVMKALEKDRTRRYETANGLAMDVERYLADEPVLACPPSATYRFAKFARRNRTALLTASLISMAMMVGTIASTWQAIRATRAESLAKAARVSEADQRKVAEDQSKLANVERAEAETQRKQAETNFNQARQAVDDFFNTVSENKLLDMPGLEPLRKELLESALMYYEGFVDQHVDDTARLADLAVGHFRVSQVMYWNGDSAGQFVPHMEKAIDILEKLVREGRDTPEVQGRLAGVFRGNPEFQYFERTDTTSAVLDKGLECAERFARIWEKFVRDNPDVPEFKSDLAGTYFYLATVQVNRKKIPQALESGEKARVIWEKLIREYPHEPRYRLDVSRIYKEMGSRYLWTLGQKQQARELYQKVLDLREQVVNEYPLVAGYRSQLGRAYRSFTDVALNLDEAGKTLRLAVEQFEKVATEFPTMRPYRKDLADAYQKLAENANDRGQKVEAIKLYRQAIGLFEALVSETPDPSTDREQLSKAFSGLAKLLEATQQPEEAKQAHQRLLDLGGVFAIAELRNMATQLDKDGKHDEAENFFRHAIEVGTKQVSEHPRDEKGRQELAWSYGSLASALAVLPDRMKVAEEAHRTALDIWEKLVGDFPKDPFNLEHIGHRHREWGAMHRSAGRHSAAVESFQKAIDVLVESLATFPSLEGSNHRRWLVDTYCQLGSELTTVNRFEEAETALQHGIVLDPNHAWSHAAMAGLYAKQNKDDQAIVYYRKAIDLNPKDSWSHHTLADLFVRQNKDDEAIASYRAAIDENSGFMWSHLNLARVLAKQNKLSEALAEAQVAVRVDPSEPQGHAFLREVLNAIGDTTQTLVVLRENVRRMPTCAAAYENLGISLENQQQTDDAIAAFSKAVELAPNCFVSHIHLAELLAKQNKFPQAVQSVCNAVEHVPHEAQPLNQLAWMLATSPIDRLRNPVLAVKLANEACQLDPMALNIPNTLGVAHYRAGNWQDAARWLSKSMQIRNGGDAIDQLFMAMSQWQLGNHSEARMWFDRAVERSEDKARTNGELGGFRTEAAKLLGALDNPASSK